MHLAYLTVKFTPLITVSVPPVATVVEPAIIVAVTSIVWGLLIVIAFALKSGESVAGLITPDEKFATGELSHTAGVFQLPEVMVRK